MTGLPWTAYVPLRCLVFILKEVLELNIQELELNSQVVKLVLWKNVLSSSEQEEAYRKGCPSESHPRIHLKYRRAHIQAAGEKQKAENSPQRWRRRMGC